MGVIYKLTPEISNFVLDKKTNEPRLSCRKLSTLINETFQVKISKSHINKIIQLRGLSSRVGRPLKPKRGLVDGSGLGAYMLKAADALLGGSAAISELMKEILPNEHQDLTLAESFVYSPLFDNAFQKSSDIWKLTGKLPQNPEGINLYLDSLQHVTSLKPKLWELYRNASQEVLWVKLTFSDGNTFTLDGQLHTLWESLDIPYQFSTTIYNIKSYINKIIKGTEPLILMTAPGYDLVPGKWFDFLVACSTPDNKLAKISFMGAESQELDHVTLSTPNSCRIIFGLWPWQYTNSRHIEPMPITSAKSFTFENTKQEYYLNDALIKLSQHAVNKDVMLRGVMLRKNQEVKLPELFLVTNISEDNTESEDIARLFLSKWPNGKAGSEEFTRVIELFTYNSSFRQLFPAEAVMKKNSGENITDCLMTYLEILDAYVRWYFLPREYREIDFSEAKKRFYALRARIRKNKNTTSVIFLPSSGYAHRKALLYAIERMNERDIFLPDGSRLWFANK